MFNKRKNNQKADFDILEKYDEISKKFGVLFLWVGVLILFLLAIIGFRRMINTFLIEDQKMEEIKSKIQKYVQSKTNFKCTECVPISYNEIAELIGKKLSYAEKEQAISIIWDEFQRNTEIYEVTTDEKVEYVRSKIIISSSLNCLFFRNLNKIITVITLSIAAIIVSLFIYFKYKQSQKCKQYSSEIIQNMVNQSKLGSREINPQSFRSNYPNINEKQWRNVVSNVERCPVVSVYRKKSGNVWQVSSLN
ncbi:hypothetical protein TVAG_067360 [Trichomonas vaginalis G3]|uniref:Uncharacterized protein n=1 Tax=Trichomonas vaginalis (strain ATCC PRA-98 / G3) TaxID=412133 RepID=A2DSF2_TRIV3|nr:hypothetical protein TVAGG3_0079920 [Trichomonas vaginalis G3]EAY16731.1 hypothetical protein TVAG_067360 [Trichomonas vaginalis G3]KAI5543172.1 hypothetical protein TVAGG3_0079920 [Trichomonas vaginalis G3]|eukprot:XP_001328954.1 hypothetical protein [Trichomonas vaginalis G3]